MRNAQKGLLLALLSPDLTDLQNRGDWTQIMIRQEEFKTLPFGDIWTEYCTRQGVPADESWYQTVLDYEKNILEDRT